MMIKCLFLILIFIASLFANWKTDRENLQKVYTFDEFRLFYSLSGKDAIFDKSDINKNDIPDIIENVALQLKVSNDLYKKVFKYKSPLLQPKYIQKEAKFIDIHFLDLGYSGNSGDGSILYDYKAIKNKAKALSIAISNKIKVGNLTPQHELFHSYQYGYTMFKNKWFLEGTARWSELILREGTGNQRRLPSTLEEMHELLNRSYSAKYFWNRLARICTKKDKDFIIPKEFKDLKYIGTNENIIEDNRIFGTNFIKILHENLDYYDNYVSKQRAYEEFGWREFQQKDFKNNKYILLAIKKTMLEIKPYQTLEVIRFVELIDEYIEEYEDTDNILNLTKNIEDLGTPYSKKYKDNSEHVFSRNMWDMQTYDNKIYLSAGNAANKGPSVNSGPLPIISYNPKSNRFKEEFIIEDEQIDFYKILDNKLIIPGNDATGSSRYGNFYLKDKNKNWKMFRNIPNALHVFDMAYFDNKLFAAIGTSKGAAIAISENFGKSWENQYLGSSRFYSFLEVNNKLFAIKRLPSISSFEKMKQDEKQKFFHLVKYKNGQFEVVYEKENLFFKDIKIKKRDSFIIKKTQKIKDKSLYIGAYNYLKSKAFYLASVKNKKLEVKRIDIDPMYQAWDFIVKGNKVYFLTSLQENKKYKNIVFELDINNLEEKAKKKFYFYSDTFARSFESLGNDFYFGMGVNIKSQRKWKQKELKEDTGKVLRIKNSLL